MSERVHTHFHEEPVSPALQHVLQEIRLNTRFIIQELKRMSKATDDLAAAVTALTGKVSSAVTEIQTLTTALQTAHDNDDDAAVEDAVTKINGLTDSITASLGSANAAVTAAANQPNPTANPPAQAAGASGVGAQPDPNATTGQAGGS